ncbi:MAG: hypothetical protein J4431_04520 [Candidatus Aenigmarchaeota archaeon]|nr:hypothetical protein [Candidatus Aenigmarchaeota archaeon]
MAGLFTLRKQSFLGSQKGRLFVDRQLRIKVAVTAYKIRSVQLADPRTTRLVSFGEAELLQTLDPACGIADSRSFALLRASTPNLNAFQTVSGSLN